MPDQTRHDRRSFVGAAAFALAGAGAGFGFRQLGASSLASGAGSADELDSLRGATGWLNTSNAQPLTAASLRGKVVLIDVWTYTCINWLRTLPYIRAWDKRYRPDGLVVIGVHSPEFAFEHDTANVRRAVAAMGITWPVAIDNDFAIWRGFSNQYWPALYLIDAKGRIRHTHFGEGEYEQSERAIQDALKAAGARDMGAALVTVSGQGAEAAADWANLKSPENYVGYERTDNFESSSGSARNERHRYTSPASLPLNHWALSGEWTVKPNSILLSQPNGAIHYGFHARDLHLVMGPSAPGASVRFRVSLDGRPPGAAHGSDVDADGNGVLAEQRLHQLIRQAGPIADRRFALEFLGAGAEAFAFTFG